MSARRPRSDRAELTGGPTRRSLQLMWRGLRAERGPFGGAVAASCVHGVLVVVTSWLLGHVTDTVVVPALAGDARARDAVWGAGLLLLGVGLATAATVAARRILAGLGVFNLQARHRRAITRQYLRLPMSWHRAHPTGQLLSNANADVEAATGVFNPLPYAIGVGAMILVAAGALFATDVWLAVAALGMLPAIVVVNSVYQRAMRPAVSRAQQLRADVSDVAHESFEATLVVKALGTADREARRFDARAQQLRHANVRVGTMRGIFDPLMDLLPNLGTLAVLAVGTARVASGAIDAGAVVSAAYLLSVMAVPVRSFGWVLGELPRGLVGWSRIARVLDARADRTTPAHRTTGSPERGRTGAVARPAAGPPARGAHLRLRDVAYAVPVPGTGRTVDLLSGIDLDLAPGRITALVGPTGAGKSTLAALIARLASPTAGQILLDGVDLGRVDPAVLTREVALVAQSTFVFQDSVRANVALVDDDEDHPDPEVDAQVWRALRAAHLDHVVRDLPGGLDARIGERGTNLSGGQRQRLAIARALYRRPRLLILDDATSAVDPRVERAILAGLREPRQDGGPTVLLIAYRMASIALADEVVHLRDGRVVSTGTHAELLDRDPGYRELATAYAEEARRRAAAADGSAAAADEGVAR